MSDGLSGPGLKIEALSSSGGYLFSGATKGGIWRRPLSEVVSVESDAHGVTGGFRLEQNYPNPFNPGTTIRYEVPRGSHVSLSLYDILGREVSVLVNERKEVGRHEITLSAQKFSSGVYLLSTHGRRIRTDKKTRSREVIGAHNDPSNLPWQFRVQPTATHHNTTCVLAPGTRNRKVEGISPEPYFPMVPLAVQAAIIKGSATVRSVSKVFRNAFMVHLRGK